MDVRITARLENLMSAAITARFSRDIGVIAHTEPQVIRIRDRAFIVVIAT
jgi:hypothetical protein